MAPSDGDLGRYRLVRLLGAGGMGEVYLARDLTLERDVALKVLPAARAEDHDSRRRFLREAQAAARLDHPCICPVFEIGEMPDGRAFIAMSYVEGETLAVRLSRGPLPVRDALALARDLADALSAAHAHDIVHRDLKPQNVMLTVSGRPKLLDFGVAKLLPAGRAASEASTATTEAKGAVIGTPAYMSPEQVAGHDVDARSDLFALGALLFECLTGQRAFKGGTGAEVMGAIAHVDPLPPSTLTPGIPADVDELCARLLAKAPGDRFQTAEEVLGALRLLLPVTHKTAVPPLPPRRWWQRSRWRRAVAVVTVLGALGGGWWIYRYQRQLPAPPAEAERWYRRGTDFIREGAFHSASAALDQAIRRFPEYPLAYARQAEALAELDDQRRAGEALLRMQAVLGDETRLALPDRLRVQGIRALVLRDVPKAVEAFRALVDRAPLDAGAWVDLGRAQEAAEQRTDARVSYERALALDAGLAAAHVRLASIESQAGLREPALTAFAEAERLYAAASNVEGQVEVLIRRGTFLDARGELQGALRDLERARALATSATAPALNIRVRLALASVTASEGRTEDAEALVEAAINDARKADLWTLVAAGLVDRGGILVNEAHRLDEADAHVAEAIRLAEGRGATRTAARATLQRAALALQRAQPELAQALVRQKADFLKAGGYRRLELTALTIAARAERDLDNLADATIAAQNIINAARGLQDEAQVAQALTTLAGAEAAAGNYPAALAARLDAESIRRKLGEEELVPIDLTNRAELLLRLGRDAEARALLVTLEEGIARGVDSYRRRAARVSQLHALDAAIAGDFARAVRQAEAALRRAEPSETVSILVRPVLAYARRRLQPGRADRSPVDPPPAAPELAREHLRWTSRAALAGNDPGEALALATAGLASAQRVGHDELAWQFAAIGTAAAAAIGNTGESDRLRRVYLESYQRLASRWGNAVSAYNTRPDVRELRTLVERSVYTPRSVPQ
jgi:tetratricopeptide (TPR) repeat protein